MNMEDKFEKMKKELEDKSNPFFSLEELKTKLGGLKTTFVVVLLIIFFNVSSVDDVLRFKKFPLFYDIQSEKSTLLFPFLKALIIGGLYYLMTYLLK